MCAIEYILRFEEAVIDESQKTIFELSDNRKLVKLLKMMANRRKPYLNYINMTRHAIIYKEFSHFNHSYITLMIDTSLTKDKLLAHNSNAFFNDIRQFAIEII